MAEQNRAWGEAVRTARGWLPSIAARIRSSSWRASNIKPATALARFRSHAACSRDNPDSPEAHAMLGQLGVGGRVALRSKPARGAPGAARSELTNGASVEGSAAPSCDGRCGRPTTTGESMFESRTWISPLAPTLRPDFLLMVTEHAAGVEAFGVALRLSRLARHAQGRRRLGALGLTRRPSKIPRIRDHCWLGPGWLLVLRAPPDSVSTRNGSNT